MILNPARATGKSTLRPIAGLQRHAIAIIVPSFEDVGGVPSVAEFLCRTIARHPLMDARVVSLATSSSDPCSVLLSDPASWFRGVTTRSGECHGEKFTHVGAYWGEIEFCRLSKREALSALVSDCSLVQVVAGVPAWACPVLDLGKPVVLQVATLVDVERKTRNRATGLLASWRTLMTRIVSRLDHFALRKADGILVENPWMLDHVRRINHDRNPLICYAPPGVDADLFRPLNGVEQPHANPYILAVGRFSDPRKNPMLLLEAYRLLLQRVGGGPDLILCGTDQPPAAFWDHAAAHQMGGRISFVKNPTTEEVAKLYRNALCLALPSHEEGFAMVVIEAMASGVPPVATRCGGPDGIITDGVDGYLVDCGNAVQMADRLAAVFLDRPLAKKIGQSARTTVERRYTEKIAGDRFLGVYERLLNIN